MTEVTETTLLRDGVWNDWEYIETLRRKEGDSLGFIPKAAYESVLRRERISNRDRWRFERILVTEDNGDLTGFCYGSFAGETATIFQICVQSDARRWHRALLMADEMEREARADARIGITCRVAYDLESNDFWKAIGYTPVRKIISTWLNQKESKSKRPLWLYVKHFNELFAERIIEAVAGESGRNPVESLSENEADR